MVNEAEKQLKEMEAAVEAKEKVKDEKVSKEFDAKAKVEERRGGPRGKFGPRESWDERAAREHKEKLERWVPKTELGRAVRSGKVTDIDVVLSEGRKIMEPEIVDLLLPGLINDTLFIGQAKGKFGGGKRRPFRQTQKKTKEGSVLTFGVMAIVGDGHGHVGIGYGRAAETLPAKEKAFRKAKLNITKIKLGCASFDCSCDEEHSIPVAVKGKCSSVVIELMPAPQGTGLVVNDELKKILRAVGIKDVYSKTSGKLRTTFNAAKACMAALNKIGEVRI
ncbi:30S ribosomal protein S5 [archaeon]|jgi:small subunit ribosomal protein S5|nr:30S ribosomal protein S5 [archaeon]MBT7128922.1 30S ribosomal protein S5 [archaeon]